MGCAAYTPQRGPCISKEITGHLVDLTSLIVTNQSQVGEIHIAVGAMPMEQAGIGIIRGSLMPKLACEIETPSNVGGGESEHVEKLAAFLISITDGIRDHR